MSNKLTKQNLIGTFLSYAPFRSHILGKLPYLYNAYYHMVDDTECIHTKHLYTHKILSQFIDDLEYIVKNFHLIDLPILLSHVKHNEPLPKKAFFLSFDDGFRQMHDLVAPILLRKGIQLFLLTAASPITVIFAFSIKPA